MANMNYADKKKLTESATIVQDNARYVTELANKNDDENLLLITQIENLINMLGVMNSILINK